MLKILEDTVIQNITYLSILFFLTSQLSHAETSKVIVKSHSSVRHVYESSSEANRMKSRFEATAHLLGVGPGYSRNHGFSFGYKLSSDSLILADVHLSDGYEWRTYSASDGNLTLSGASKTRHQGLGIHYKQFNGNSFYYRIGADYMNVEYKYNHLTPSLFSSSYNSNFKGEVLYTNVSIGNQWQWDNFTLGCDWVGFTTPIYGRINDANISGSYTDYDFDSFKDDQTLYTQNSLLVLLRFYMGTSF
jgi:hypothetical protein